MKVDNIYKLINKYRAEGFWSLMAIVDGRSWVAKFRVDKIIVFKMLDEEYDIP